jgi:hypothetical protein
MDIKKNKQYSVSASKNEPHQDYWAYCLEERPLRMLFSVS